MNAIARAIFGTAGRRNKYGARKITIDGIVFASQKEGSRYRALKFLRDEGRIKDLELQPRYEFVVNGVKIGRYTADFRYRELMHGVWNLVVEDVKGMVARDFPLRVKLMKALHGVEVRKS